MSFFKIGQKRIIVPRFCRVYHSLKVLKKLRGPHKKQGTKIAFRSLCCFQIKIIKDLKVRLSNEIFTISLFLWLLIAMYIFLDLEQENIKRVNFVSWSWLWLVFTIKTKSLFYIQKDDHFVRSYGQFYFWL